MNTIQAAEQRAEQIATNWFVRQILRSLARKSTVVTFVHNGWLHYASGDVEITESGRIIATWCFYESRTTGRYVLLATYQHLDIEFEGADTGIEFMTHLYPDGIAGRA